MPLGAVQHRHNILSSVNFTSNAIRPYRGFGDVNFAQFRATSNYNALQTHVSRRFAAHLTMNASYVWLKAMDEVVRMETWSATI